VLPTAVDLQECANSESKAAESFILRGSDLLTRNHRRGIDTYAIGPCGLAREQVKLQCMQLEP
jgi:hypothetical protein